MTLEKEKEKAVPAAPVALPEQRCGVAVDLPTSTVLLSAMRQLWEISEKMVWAAAQRGK